jgi:hypothetical protein
MFVGHDWENETFSAIYRGTNLHRGGKGLSLLTRSRGSDDGRGHQNRVSNRNHQAAVH